MKEETMSKEQDFQMKGETKKSLEYQGLKRELRRLAAQMRKGHQDFWDLLVTIQVTQVTLKTSMCVFYYRLSKPLWPSSQNR